MQSELTVRIRLERFRLRDSKRNLPDPATMVRAFWLESSYLAMQTRRTIGGGSILVDDEGEGGCTREVRVDRILARDGAGISAWWRIRR